MFNYYYRFLFDVVIILEFLYQFLRKGLKWQWKKEQQEVFVKFKELLQLVEFLVYFDLVKEFVFVIDVLDYGVGVVLFYKMEGGIECLIGYMFRFLNGVERNYFILEKEVLVIIFGVKKFYQFFYGYLFIIKMDYKFLEGLLNEKKGILVFVVL